MIIIFLLIGLYSVSLMYLGYVWSTSKTTMVREDKMALRAVSIVIAYRNEKTAIPKLVASLGAINYPKDKLEIVFVNDHSTDDSNSILNDLLTDFPFHFQNLNLEENKGGKKNAQILGVKAARHELIMTTDADCEVPNSWVSNCLAHFKSEDIHLVTSNLTFSGKGFWSDLMRTELAPLLGLTGVSISLNNPILANGANMAFRKASYLAVLTRRNDIDDIPSGDDTFLLQAIMNEYGKKSVAFGYDNVILTEPPVNIKEFFHQRIRWAAKWSFNTSFRSKLLPIGIWLFHLSIAIFWVYFLMKGDLLSMAMLMGTKLLGEFVFIRLIFNSYPFKLKNYTFLIAAFFYSFYVIFFGLSANFIAYKWKERPYG